MKISNKLNHSIRFKFLWFLPLLLLVYIILLPYIYIGNLGAALREPVCLKTFVDNFIPFYIYVIYPYLIWSLFPIAGIVFVFYRKISVKELISIYSTHILLVLSCYLIYLIFPTTAECVMINTYDPSILNHRMFEAIQYLYTSSTPYNAFPSYHVAPMVFLSIFLYKRWRWLFWITLPFAILASIATVLLKFHVFADILGGIAMGVFSYYILYEKIALKYTNKFIIVEDEVENKETPQESTL